MALERELDTFRNSLPSLLDREGKYVLIQGDQIIGVWDTKEEAGNEGYQRYLNEPFLVKRIAAVEKPLYYSRDINPCHT